MKNGNFPPSLDEIIAVVRRHIDRIETAQSLGVIFDIDLTLPIYKPELEALNFALAHLEASQWQPISEAPDDGEPQLIVQPTTGGLEQLIAYRTDAWYEYYSGTRIGEPMMFRSLPSPPVTTGEGEGR